MKKFLFTIPIFLAALAIAYPQAPFKVYTSPKLPMRDALDRMNLTVAWNARVSVDGNRDGIFSIQLLPGKQNQLLVQTYKGNVFLYDADHGDLIWKNQVGLPYWTPQPAGFNSHGVYVTRRNVLHVLSRVDGSQRVYTFNTATKQADFGYELAIPPNAAPIADEDLLYFSMGDRINAVVVPNFEAIEQAKRIRDKFTKEGKQDAIPPYLEELIPAGLDSAQPVFLWSYRFANQFTTSTPLIHGDVLSALTTDGTLTSVARFDKGPREELAEFKAIGKSLGAPGQHRDIAYIGSDDFNLYAVSMAGGRLVWRYVSGAPILLGPAVNDRDVFVSPERTGLARVDRVTGREVWLNRDTQRFLAANGRSGDITAAIGTGGVNPIVLTSPNHGLRTGATVTVSGVADFPAANGTYSITNLTDHTFALNGTRIEGNSSGRGSWATLTNNVYALDRIGKFYVIDGRRGTTLATHDLSDWAISIANEWTDRIYLAANDGQILCLRHRDLIKPLVMKTAESLKVKEEKKPAIEPKKDDDKKDDKKDDKEKAARLGRLIDQPRLPTIGDAPLTARTVVNDRRLWAGR